MVKSIRFRLLLWYAAVLFAVVAGFASLLYFEVRDARLTELDAELQSTTAGLEASLRLFPPHEVTGENPPPRKQPPPGKKDFLPKRGGEPQDAPPRDRLMNSLRVPGPQGRPGERPPVYFAVWRPDGTLVKAVDLPAGIDEMPAVVDRPITYFRGNYRERTERGPHGSTILAGRDAGNLPAELTSFAWRLIATGSVVLAVGLLGGWLISRRILRPISAIAATASRISGTSLKERIDTNRVDSELSELANVLNETFDRLEEAFARQARFTADASHELRTPLAVIKAQAELTLSRPRSAGEYQAAIEACLRGAVRMTDLVERLLLLARADEGWPLESRALISLDRVVSEVLAQLGHLARQKEVEFVTNLDPVTLHADAPAIAQVASNLIANAIHYNKPDGQVRVNVRAEGAEAVLTVRDTGPGISPEDLGQIFQRFFRVDQSRTRPAGGTGLGLAICKSIVEAHGGSIECESVVGKGSTFRVRLPMGEPPANKTSE